MKQHQPPKGLPERVIAFGLAVVIIVAGYVAWSTPIQNINDEPILGEPELVPARPKKVEISPASITSDSGLSGDEKAGRTWDRAAANWRKRQ